MPAMNPKFAGGVSQTQAGGLFHAQGSFAGHTAKKALEKPSVKTADGSMHGGNLPAQNRPAAGDLKQRLFCIPLKKMRLYRALQSTGRNQRGKSRLQVNRFFVLLPGDAFADDAPYFPQGCGEAAVQANELLREPVQRGEVTGRDSAQPRPAAATGDGVTILPPTHDSAP